MGEKYIRPTCTHTATYPANYSLNFEASPLRNAAKCLKNTVELPGGFFPPLFQWQKTRNVIYTIFNAKKQFPFYANNVDSV